MRACFFFLPSSFSSHHVLEDVDNSCKHDLIRKIQISFNRMSVSNTLIRVCSQRLFARRVIVLLQEPEQISAKLNVTDRWPHVSQEYLEVKWSCLNDCTVPRSCGCKKKKNPAEILTPSPPPPCLTVGTKCLWC